jgi:Chromosome segregation ATPases
VSIEAIDKEIVLKEEEQYKMKTEILELNEKKSSKISLVNIINSRLSEIKNELSSLNHVVDSSLSSEEEKITNEYYSTLKKKEILVKDIEVLVRDKDILSAKIDEMDAINRLNNSELFKVEKELKSLEINISKMEFKLDDYLKTLSEEYELTYEKAKANYVLDIDPDIAGSEVSKYKSLIKSIGMVNVDSIEDYKRVSERYDFLSSQRNDLLNAKDTLIEIIDEMDAVMKDEFLITFEKIQIEFKKVFKELFGGGNADLKLTDPNNVLETGIEIVASPPGKTLKSITLLSGGEMTLTAISLIFAILNIRSVPFCIFDEVEAALDEANVDNFGKYLNHYKDKTQFLIITHKKKTMEYADTLYGITMQESGVSKLVSVKLDKIIN